MSENAIAIPTYGSVLRVKQWKEEFSTETSMKTEIKKQTETKQLRNEIKA